MINRPLNNVTARIDRLPRDARGYPVPKFVHWKDGVPDFRIIDPNHMAKCIKRNACWICGDPMGTHKAFVIGPMCCINRISAEPPSHRDCAIFAATNCPFLTTPTARRNERGLPENKFVAGTMIERNPGVTALWMTRSYQLMHATRGVLFIIGEPDSVEFYARGRTATRAEIEESVTSGYPLLIEEAKRDGWAAIDELARMRRRFDNLLDEAVPS